MKAYLRNTRKPVLAIALILGAAMGSSLLLAQTRSLDSSPQSQAPTVKLATRTDGLQIGDPAPELKALKWLKGEPVPRFVAGKVYLVDFWATWCAPCIAMIPHLSELAGKYAGRVTFLGLNAGDEDAQTVGRFFRKAQNRMGYTVAMEEPISGAVAKTWKGVYGLPSAAIIDQKGRIAWIGAPSSTDLESVIDDVLEGVWDLDAAKEQRQKKRAGGDLEGRELIRSLTKASDRKDYLAVLQESEKLEQQVDRYPRLKRDIFHAKLNALLHLDKAAAVAYARENAGKWSNHERIGKALAVTEGLPRSGYEFAIECLNKVWADSKMPLTSRLYVFGAALAEAYYRIGHLQKAIDVQQQLVEMGSDGGMEFAKGSLLVTWREKLEFYRSRKANKKQDLVN